MNVRCPQCRTVVEAPDDWIDQGGYRCSSCGRTNRPPKEDRGELPPAQSDIGRKPAREERTSNFGGCSLALAALVLAVGVICAIAGLTNEDGTRAAVLAVFCAIVARIFQEAAYRQ